MNTGQPQKNKQIALLLSARVLTLCALVVVALTLFVLMTSHWHGPFRDMWEIYPFLQKIMANTWTFADLWESYGYSHRLFIPRLLFIADHRWFDASNHLLIAVSVFCQCIICFVFSLALMREDSLSTAEKRGLLSVVVVLQFSSTLLFNFMHTFDVQWFVCCTCVVLAFFILSRLPSAKATEGRAEMLVSGGLIVLACLNNFSGMVAWPLWLLLCCKNVKSPSFKTAVILMAALFVLCYMQGVHTAGFHELTTGSALAHAVLLAVFPLIYLVSPLADKDFLPFGNAVILLLLPVLFYLLRYGWKFLFTAHSAPRKLSRIFLACLGLFGVGVAVVTAVGRGYDPANFHASRYQNIVLLFWSAMILLIWIEERDLPRTALGIACRGLCALIFSAYLYCQWTGWNQYVHLGAQVNRAHLALMLGFSHDVPMIAPTISRSMIYVPGYNLERERALYEQAQKGIFHGAVADAWRNGISLSQISRPCPEIKWNTSLYQGSYSRFTAFTVSGSTKGVEAALLTDNGGKVLAVAIPSEMDTLWASLTVFLGLKNPVLRGFAVTDSPLNALVMLSSGSTQPSACKLLL